MPSISNDLNAKCNDEPLPILYADSTEGALNDARPSNVEKCGGIEAVSEGGLGGRNKFSRHTPMTVEHYGSNEDAARLPCVCCGHRNSPGCGICPECHEECWECHKGIGHKANFMSLAISATSAAIGSHFHADCGSSPSNTAARYATLTSTFSYAASLTFYYRAHEGDEHRDDWLLGGIMAGVSIGLASGAKMQDLMVNILPWTMLLSLFLSSFLHQMARNKRHRKGRCRGNEKHGVMNDGSVL